MVRKTNPPNEGAPAEPTKTKKPEDCNKFKVKTHTDGDFRMPKPALAMFGFGNHVELQVEVLECGKGDYVKLLIKKA